MLTDVVKAFLHKAIGDYLGLLRQPAPHLRKLQPDPARVQALKTVALKAEKPTEDEVEIAEVFVAEAPSPTPAQLPATASNMPLFGILGLASLAIAFAFHRVAKGLR